MPPTIISCSTLFLGGGIRTELKELISLLRVKVKSGRGPSFAASDADQWQWLSQMLSDPVVSDAYLLHDQVAEAYEQCRQALPDRPRSRWPVLPGLAHYTLTAVRQELSKALQQPVRIDSRMLNAMSVLHWMLSVPKFTVSVAVGL